MTWNLFDVTPERAAETLRKHGFTPNADEAEARRTSAWKRCDAGSTPMVRRRERDRGAKKS